MWLRKKKGKEKHKKRVRKNEEGGTKMMEGKRQTKRKNDKDGRKKDSSTNRMR